MSAPRYRFRSGFRRGVRTVTANVSDLPEYRAKAERILGGTVSVVYADSRGTTYVRSVR